MTPTPIQTTHCLCRFREKNDSDTIGTVYLNGVWFANVYQDTDGKKWGLNRCGPAIDAGMPCASGWLNSPQECLDHIENWLATRNQPKS